MIYAITKNVKIKIRIWIFLSMLGACLTRWHGEHWTRVGYFRESSMNVNIVYSCGGSRHWHSDTHTCICIPQTYIYACIHVYVCREWVLMNVLMLFSWVSCKFDDFFKKKKWKINYSEHTAEKYSGFKKRKRRILIWHWAIQIYHTWFYHIHARFHNSSVRCHLAD